MCLLLSQLVKIPNLYTKYHIVSSIEYYFACCISSIFRAVVLLLKLRRKFFENLPSTILHCMRKFRCTPTIWISFIATAKFYTILF
jgi:hypothetical protein